MSEVRGAIEVSHSVKSYLELVGVIMAAVVIVVMTVRVVMVIVVFVVAVVVCH